MIRPRSRTPGPWAVVGVSIIALGAATFAIVAIGTLAPKLQAALGFSRAEIGVLTSLIFVGSVFTSRLGGRLTDSFGPARVLGFSLAAFAATMGLAAAAPNAALFMAAIFLAGLLYGGVNPPTNVVVAGRLRRRRLGFFLSLKQSGVPIGGLLAGAVLPPIAVAFGWRIAFVVGVAACFAAAATTPLLRGATVLRAEGGHADSPLGRRQLAGLGAFGFVMAGTQWTFLTYLSLYLTERLNFSLSLAGLALVVAQGVGAGARLVWGWSLGDPSDSTPFVANGLALWCQQNYLAKKYGLDLHSQYLRAGINDSYLVGVLRGYDTTLMRSRSDRAKLDWDFERIVAQAKSAAVMHMLGGILGEDKLQEVVRGILKTSKQLILTDRDFQKRAQAATTAKLDGFFDQWLRTKDYLDYYLSHVRVNKTDNGYEVHADVWKTGTASMPVEIVAEDLGGGRVRALFPADRASGEMAIPLKASLASIALDPLQRLPLLARVGVSGRLDLADSLMAEGKLLRADEQIDQALSDDPQNPRTLFMKGRILKERGDWAAALSLWSKVTSLSTSSEDPARIWSQLWTARIYDLQGKRSEATALYTAVSTLPDMRGSRAAATAGLQIAFTDAWPPLLP